MIIQGLNSDVAIASERYHVQTENVGENLITLVFKGGAVIARAKQRVAAVEGEQRSEKIRKLMRNQHELMVSKLKAGDLVSVAEGKGEKTDKEEKDLIAKFLQEWAEEE